MPLIPLAYLVAALLAPPAADTLRLTLVVDDTTRQRSLVHGAVLGVEEAAHTGALFGVVVQLRVATAANSSGAARAYHQSAGSPPTSIAIVAGPADVCAGLGAAAAHDSTIVFDAGCAPSWSPRPANVFSLVSLPTASTGDDSTHLELWHWTLDRFGAEQLNQRYARRFGERMDSPAWAGWAAVKIALDLALHAHAAGAARLRRQLDVPRQQFDGQKGRPLYFAPGTRRLVQPLYRVAGSGDAARVVAEVAP